MQRPAPRAPREAHAWRGLLHRGLAWGEPITATHKTFDTPLRLLASKRKSPKIGLEILSLQLMPYYGTHASLQPFGAMPARM